MARIVALDDVRAEGVEKTGRSGKTYRRTSLVTPLGDDDPQVYLIENSPQMTIGSHFHDVDQFQIFVGGDGRIGMTEVSPISVHFARAFTTYGPIETRSDGLAWMTLRPRRDLGAKMIDQHRGSLERNPGRRPWQTTIPARMPAPGTTGAAATIELLRGEFGLSATAIKLGAGESAIAPDPSTSPCQYILVTAGSLIADGIERKGLAVVHVPPTDPAFRLVAGDQGLLCLVLNFPDPEQVDTAVADTRAASPAAASEPMSASQAAAGLDPPAQWHCELCGFVYEEAEGLPAHDIPAGTRWADVPESFRCPDCAAEKQDFTPLSL